MPPYSVLGRKSSIQQYPTVVMETPPVGGLPIVAVVIQLQTQKGRAARLLYKNVTSLLSEESQ